MREINKPLSRFQYKEMRDSAVSDLCKARPATFNDQGRLLLRSTEKDQDSGLYNSRIELLDVSQLSYTIKQAFISFTKPGLINQNFDCSISVPITKQRKGEFYLHMLCRNTNCNYTETIWFAVTLQNITLTPLMHCVTMY